MKIIDTALFQNNPLLFYEPLPFHGNPFIKWVERVRGPTIVVVIAAAVVVVVVVVLL